MNYINPCRDVEKMLIKLSIYYERLQNDEISYFLPDVPTCSVEMFKYIFKGRLVKHGTIREAYIRCVIGEVQK